MGKEATIMLSFYKVNTEIYAEYNVEKGMWVGNGRIEINSQLPEGNAKNESYLTPEYEFETSDQIFDQIATDLENQVNISGLLD
jgi:hypothetical protein